MGLGTGIRGDADVYGTGGGDENADGDGDAHGPRGGSGAQTRTGMVVRLARDGNGDEEGVGEG